MVHLAALSAAQTLRIRNVFLLGAWLVVPPAITLAVSGSFFLSIILYFVLPAVYFSWHAKDAVGRTLLASLWTIPVVMVFDYMAFLNNAWVVPSIFNVHIMRFIPLEDFLFTFCGFYLILVGFQYFFQERKQQATNYSRLRSFSVIVGFIFLLFMGAYLRSPDFTKIPYYYIWLLLLCFIVPTFLLLWLFPSYRKPLCYILPFFTLLMLPWELIALHFRFWAFPSTEYIGYITLLGLTFPIEEFLAWSVFFPAAALFFMELTIGQNHPRFRNGN